jgi:hypothetical protein
VIIIPFVLFLIAAIGLPVTSDAAEARPAWVWVSFELEGAKVSCPDLRVVFRLKSKTTRLKRSDRHKGAFEIPAAGAEKETVDIHFRCGRHKLSFPNVQTGSLRSGVWRVGIAHPPFPDDLVAGLANAERAEFVSYLIFEPNDREGLEIVRLHFDPESQKR